MSGAEFGEKQLPGKLNTDYLYATTSANNAYFAKKNQKIVRIPFRWERLQPKKYGALSSKDLEGLKEMVNAATLAHQRVILDLHNYGRYYETPLTVSSAPELSDVWRRLALEFKNNPTIYGYELMNEPHDLPEGGEGWAEIVQAVTTEIRKVDTQTTLIIPGYGWQNAHRWPENNPTLLVQDPSNKVLYAAHQYFDADYTGSYKERYGSNVSPQRTIQDTEVFLHWLTEKNVHGIFTEFGSPSSKEWLGILDAFMAHISQSDRVIGAIYWGAGPWWGEYILSVHPLKNIDQPQMKILEKYCRSIGSEKPDVQPDPVLMKNNF